MMAMTTWDGLMALRSCHMQEAYYHGLWNQMNWALDPGSNTCSFVTLKKWLNLSKPPFFSFKGISVLTCRIIMKATWENMCTKEISKMFVTVFQIKMNLKVLYKVKEVKQYIKRWNSSTSLDFWGPSHRDESVHLVSQRQNILSNGLWVWNVTL